MPEPQPARRLGRRMLPCVALAALTTLLVAWIACFLAAPVRHNHIIAAGGQEWSVSWGGNAALRWESAWAVQVAPALERTIHIEGGPDDRLLAAIEQTAARLPTDDFAATPLGRTLHLKAAPNVAPAPGCDTGVVLRRAGWPLPALHGWQAATIRPRTATEERRGLLVLPGTSTLLPFKPLAAGLLLDILFYTGLFALGFAAAQRGRAAVRRRNNRCARCGYDLRGLRAGKAGAITCPECGHAANR